MDSIPDKGVAIFCGIADGEKYKYVVDDPPNVISENRYICSDEFQTETIRSVVDTSDEHIVVVVERGKCCIASKKGDRIEVIDEIESHVMGKSKAGGQSAQRFRRVREKQKEQFFKKVSRRLEDICISNGKFIPESLIVGGTNITVDEFIDFHHHHEIQKNIIGPYNVSYASKSGVQSSVDKAEKTIQNQEESYYRNILEEFFEGLTSNSVAYGIDEVKRALDWKAVDVLIISEEFDSKEKLVEDAEQIGADVYILPITFDKAQVFDSEFGGIGALLHYQMN